MSIVRGRLKPYALRMTDPWPSADGPIAVRSGWVIALEDEAGRVGLGDAAPWPGFGLESHASAGSALRLAMERVIGLPREAYAGAIAELPRLAPVAAAPAARSAIDTAIHDLIAQEAGLPLARYLGGRSALTEVPANVAIPRVTPRRAAELGAKAVASGAGTLKLKVGGVPLAEDRARIEALRSGVGQDVKIRLDANGAWSEDEAIAALRSFAPLGIEYVEQPVPADALAAMARIRDEGSVRVAADEAVRGVRSAEAILYGGAADILILKPTVLGGLRVARAVLNLAQEHGVPVVVTSLLESAVGRTAALHFAASLGETPHAHGIATAGVLAEDIAEAPAITGGRVRVLERPGLGVAPGEAFWRDASLMEAE
ncbi:MAG: o-succinylbenzoate synthase [Candidatus Latescibacteria bacterium]|nr:o-succinylbenzoate synthase [Candidatus Latescibacterota bacterium]